MPHSAIKCISLQIEDKDLLKRGRKFMSATAVKSVKTSTEERLVIFRRKSPKFNVNMAIFATLYSLYKFSISKNDVT